MNGSVGFRHLESPETWTEAFGIMQQLRPHLTDAAAFCAQLRQQREEAYRLLAAYDASGMMLGLAGYRTQTNLLYGRFVYVDDLVVSENAQRSGIGARLLDAVRQVARNTQCRHFVLDTGLHMPLAQRFYYRNGLLAKGMHFVETLESTQ